MKLKSIPVTVTACKLQLQLHFFFFYCMKVASVERRSANKSWVVEDVIDRDIEVD